MAWKMGQFKWHYTTFPCTNCKAHHLKWGVYGKWHTPIYSLQSSSLEMSQKHCQAVMLSGFGDYIRWTQWPGFNSSQHTSTSPLHGLSLKHSRSFTSLLLLRDHPSVSSAKKIGFDHCCALHVISTSAAPPLTLLPGYSMKLTAYSCHAVV